MGTCRRVVHYLQLTHMTYSTLTLPNTVSVLLFTRHSMLRASTDSVLRAMKLSEPSSIADVLVYQHSLVTIVTRLRVPHFNLLLPEFANSK